MSKDTTGYGMKCYPDGRIEATTGKITQAEWERLVVQGTDSDSFLPVHSIHLAPKDLFDRLPEHVRAATQGAQT